MIFFRNSKKRLRIYKTFLRNSSVALSTCRGSASGLWKPKNAVGQRSLRIRGKTPTYKIAQELNIKAGKPNQLPAKRKLKGRRENETRANTEVVIPVYVKQARLAYTCVTSIWSTGHPGPLAINFSESAHVPTAMVQKFNEDFKGRLWISISKTSTHYFTAELTMEYWDHALTPAFDRRRRFLEMKDDTERGAIIFDRFTGNLPAT